MACKSPGRKPDFARLNRRPHEHQLADFLRPQRGHRGGHSQVGLARARRPVAEHNVVLGDGLDVAGLALGAGADLPACEDGQGPWLGVGFALLYAGQHAADIFGGHVTVALGLGLEFLQDVRGTGHGPFVALHVDMTVPRRYGDGKRLTDSPHVLIAGAEER